MGSGKNKHLRILICGFGSIGQRYVRILKRDFDVDITLFREKGRGNPFKLPELYRWADVRSYGPDIAFITNPTYRHVPTALAAVSAGAHILLEKPISHSMAGVGRLEEACRAANKVGYVAYTLRFVPIVKLAKKLLTGRRILHGRAVCSSSLLDWRSGRDLRECYSSHRAQGGGVILECSHEFDLMEYLMGDVKKIIGGHGRAAGITVDAEDYADAVMQFSRGACANVHLNFMSRKLERFFHVDFEDGFLRGDLLSHTLVFHHRGREKTYRLPCDRDDYFRDQVRFFLGHLDDPKMMNNLSEAKGLFKNIVIFRRTAHVGIGHDRGPRRVQGRKK